MVEYLTGFVKSKWGVVAIFSGAALLVGAEVVPHTDDGVQVAATGLVGVVGAGLGLAVAKLVAHFTGPKAPAQ